ncbi:MAG: ABC transporter permease [Chloroflexota bacterium]
MDLTLFAQLLVYGLADGAVVALNAMGFSLAYSVARQINLAHGSVFALTTVVVANLATFVGATGAAPLPFRIVWLLAFCVLGAAFGAILNMAVERLAFRPFRKVRDPLAPLIASVALSFILLQAAVWWHDARFVAPPGAHQGVDLPLLAMPDLVPPLNLAAAGLTFTLKDLLVLVIAAGVALGGAAFLARTRTGRLLRAVAQDPETTILMGGDPDHDNLLAFSLAGALAGLGATIYAAYFGGANAQYGLRAGLAALTAAVLGGVGDPRGALLGGILLGVVSSFSDYLLDAQWTPVLVLLLLIALLAFRPTGLLGTRSFSSDLDPPTTRPVMSAAGANRTSTRVLLALFGAAALFPFLDQAAGWSRLPTVTTIMVTVVLAIGLTVVVGFAGLLDLGYAAFFAIGAYTAAVLTGSGSRIAFLLPDVAHQPILGLIAAAVVAAAFGVLFGLPSIRTRGEYLAIVTLAFGEIVPLVIWHLGDWTGGARGMSGIPGYSVGRDANIGSYAAVVVMAALVCWTVTRLSLSRLGRAWAAVREDDVAAASFGINPPEVKIVAFGLGAGIAGVAGAAFAQVFGYVEPGQFDLNVSITILSAVVIGGRWGVPGAVFGALAVAVYDRFLVQILTGALHTAGDVLSSSALQSADLRQHGFAIFGTALYLATLFRARGRS